MNIHMRSVKVLFFSVVLLGATACSEIARVGDLPLGTSHSAHELCSRLFVSEQDPALIIEDVLVQKVYPLQWIWNIDIDHDNQTVTVGAPFFSGFNSATAVYRTGQGCTLTHGKDIAELQATAIDPVAAPFDLPDDEYWPDGRLGVYPELEGYDMAVIEHAIDDMFAESSSNRFEQINTYAVLLVHNGRLIAERYSEGHDKDNKMLGWSISKSVTALLLGILHAEGKVALSDVVLLENAHEHEWELTLQHLFNMVSGLDFDEGYEGKSDIAQMLYREPDASAYVKSRPLRYKPGTRFNYSTGDTQILSDIIQQAVGGTAQSAHEFYQQALFHKLFIDSAVVEHDAGGTFIGGARMFMKPRDWARIGLLMLNGGRWKEQEVVPGEWIEAMLTPSEANDSYGGQVWLYEAATFGEQFPDDAYALWGVLGQLVVVVPSQDLVLVRFGANGSGLPEDITVRRTVFRPMLDIIPGLPHPAAL